MPSPHSSSSHSSSSHSSSSSSGSSHSSGSFSSHSSGHSSRSSYHSWDRDRDSDSNNPTRTRVMLIIVITLLILSIFFHKKNSSRTVNHETPTDILWQGEAVHWDDQSNAWVTSKLVKYRNGETKYFPIEQASEENSKSSLQNGSSEERKLSDLELFGREFHLAERVPGVWRITEDGGGKTLLWDDGEQSYYDADSELWLWYNTDVDPALWQYWYEPISGDYGKYGWMEYENETWFIETSQGNWIEVPEKYDVSALWHIETDD